MNYTIVKLDKPIYRPGKRIFKFKIIRTDDKSEVFLFQDLKTAKSTLEKLDA